MTGPPAERAAEAEASADAEGAAEAPSEERIAALEAEVAELREAHARALADHQNYRRRSEQHWADRARSVLAETVSRYLPLLDDLDRAVASVDDDIAEHQWIAGVRLVHQKFQETLAASGLEPIEADGVAFDPSVHEAISFAPGPENTVVAAVRAGYTIGDYVVRPAQVVVGDGSVAGSPPPDSS